MVRAVLKSYRKNILREMKDNLSRMVSLFGIVALGVMMLTGLMSFAPSMRIAGQKYYVQQNVFDLRVLSTLGLTEQDIAAIAAHCAGLCQHNPALAGFRLHRNGNNVALLPPWLDKSHAVAYVKHKLAQRHPGVVTFGMGDSLVDLAFMNECQYMIVPTASQIAQLRMGAL